METRIELRKWTIEDLGSLVRYADNEQIAMNMSDAFPSPYTVEDGIKYIDRVSKDDPTKVFAVTFNSEVVGSIGVFPETDIHRKNAAIAYWVAKPFWGKGIATEAIKKMVDYGFRSFDITRIFAKPLGTNIGSQRVLEKAGFTLEAKLSKTIFKNGQFIDEFIYGIRR